MFVTQPGSATYGSLLSEFLLGELNAVAASRHHDVGQNHVESLLAHPLQSSQFLLGLLAHGLRHLGLFDLRPVLLDDRSVVLVQLLAD